MVVGILCQKASFLRKIAILAHCKPYIAAYFCKQRNFIVYIYFTLHLKLFTPDFEF